jgi:hypothetical protein
VRRSNHGPLCSRPSTLSPITNWHQKATIFAASRKSAQSACIAATTMALLFGFGNLIYGISLPAKSPS